MEGTTSSSLDSVLLCRTKILLLNSRKFPVAKGTAFSKIFVKEGYTQIFKSFFYWNFHFQLNFTCIFFFMFRRVKNFRICANFTRKIFVPLAHVLIFSEVWIAWKFISTADTLTLIFIYSFFRRHLAHEDRVSDGQSMC